MKRLLLLFCMVFGVVDAQLQIRRNHFKDRVCKSCGYHSTYDFYHHNNREKNSEQEVNRLRMDAIKAYDSGTYIDGIGGWGKMDQEAMNIQTKLGYTVPEQFDWGN